MKKELKALEMIACTSSLKTTSESELSKVLNPLDLDSNFQQALLNRDISTLEALLNVRRKIVCMINVAETDEEDAIDNEESIKAYG